MKVLMTGASGLVGSYFYQTAKDKLEIIRAGREEADIYLDLLSEDNIKKVIGGFDGQAVINFAAFTNVDKAEDEKGDKNGQVYLLNTKAPKILAESCLKKGLKLFHISTDYVFDGLKESAPYLEDDLIGPVDSWYAITKEWGEKQVFKNGDDRSCIIRISYPYSPVYLKKNDFLRVVVNRLESGLVYEGIFDQKIKPLSVIEAAEGLLLLLERNGSGIYHLAGEGGKKGFVTPFEFALKAAEVFGLDKKLLSKISFEQFSRKRTAPRPKDTWLSTQKIKELGMKFRQLEEVLELTKKQFKRA